jgi:hypothetical protein
MSVLRGFVVSLVLAGVGVGAAARDVRVALGARGAIVLSVPDNWRESIEQANPNVPPTVTFTPAEGRGFQVLITPIWPGVPNAPTISPGALREQVRHASDAAQPQAVERELTVVDFSGPSGFGAYFSATDRAPEPDGYKYLTQGMVAATDLRVTFTVLVNGNPAPVVQQALTALRTMKREPAKTAN